MDAAAVRIGEAPATPLLGEAPVTPLPLVWFDLIQSSTALLRFLNQRV